MRIPVILLASLLGAATASAATFRPSMILYGVVRDSFGIRLHPDTAMVSAFLGSNEVARTTVRVQPAGANYRFDINVSDPLTAAPYQVVPGSILTLRVRTGATTQPTIGPNTFVATGSGSSLHRDLTLGVDTDADGIPDDWEQMVIANSGGAITSLSQIGPGMDLDHDGMTDDQEFLSGSFAFLPGDELRLSALTRWPNGRLSFQFTTVSGAAYSVETTPKLEAPDWRICPVSLTPTAELQPAELTGNGQVLTIYFAPAGPTDFYRLRAR